ncbi:MAG: GAF domain-containing protein [Chloroflexi bacterium]|jgi:putative methionine-R-sulfoxide reductase with GAF domain|nr:GAF domain-containing protein [Chloroflexota bacterium]
MTDGDATTAADLVAAREALAAIGRRAEIARRLEVGGTEAVLRSIVEAAVLLFEAEAASLALFDAARNLLVFRVAAGAQGQGVVGLEIPPDRGLVGYVFSTGQALAISDVARDPRFGRAFAEQTQYVPRSIVAVPLVDDRGTIGVLEVLDKRTEATFSIRDVELAGVFARQASVAIRASRVERDVAALLGEVLGTLAGEDAAPDGVESLVAAAVADIGGPDDPLWPLVEQIAALRRASPEQLELVAALLAVLVRHAERGGGGRGSGSGRGLRRRASER